jgi:uncharacterized membrane protein
MTLDIRIPTGLLFTIIGLILTLWGIVSGEAIYRRSLDINVNFYWGLVLTGFGLVMLALAWTAAWRKRRGMKDERSGMGDEG